MSEIKSDTQYNDLTLGEIHLDRNQISGGEFYDCSFVLCSFAETEFLNCKFNNCVFEQCDLSLMRVTGSTFPGTRFVNSKVMGVDWTLVNWSASLIGEPLSFLECSINHSTFIGLHLKGISIKDCMATDVDFRDSDLFQANLSGTNFAESLFTNTNLIEADFRNAQNYDINPVKNTLTKAKFSLPEAMALLFSMDIELSGSN